MKTVFISRFPHGNSQRFVYDFLVAQGITPIDVMVICPQGRMTNQALARFATEDLAWQAVLALDGKANRGNCKAFLAHEELAEPSNERLNGLWINYVMKNTAAQ
jgi:hypothetical protein